MNDKIFVDLTLYEKRQKMFMFLISIPITLIWVVCYFLYETNAVVAVALGLFYTFVPTMFVIAGRGRPNWVAENDWNEFQVIKKRGKTNGNKK